MHTVAIVNFTTGFLTIFLGLLVYAMSPHVRIKRLWLILSSFVALWSFGFGMVAIADDKSSALFWARAVQNPAAIFIPVTFLHFILVFMNSISDGRRKLILAGYLFGTLLLILNFTNLYTDVRYIPQTRIYTISAKEAYLAYFLFFCFYIGIAFYEMLRKWKSIQGQRTKSKLLYLILASTIGFLGGASTFPLDFDLILSPYGLYLIPFYVMLVTYAIIEHQLMDIELALRRGMAFIVLLLTMLIPLYLMGILLISLLEGKTSINFFSLTSIFTSFAAIFFGLFVYLHDRGNLVNRMWAIFSAAFAFWSFNNGLLTSTSNKTVALLCDRLGHFGTIFIPILYLHFILRFLGKNVGVRKKIVIAGYALSGLFTAIHLADLLFKTHLFTEDVRPIASFAYYTKAGVLYLPFFLTFSALAAYAVLELIISCGESIGLRRNQIMYMLLAAIVGFSGGLTNFLPAFGMDVYPYGNYLVPLYIFAMSYATVKYRLMDVHVLAKKSLAYAIVLLCISVPTFLAVLWAERTYFHTISYPFSIFLMLLLFFVVIGFYFVMMAGGEEAITSLLFKGRYDYYEILADFTQAMVSILDLRELTAKLLRTLSLIMGIDKVSLFLLNGEWNRYELAASRGLDEQKLKGLTFSPFDPFPRWLQEKGGIVLKEELEREPPPGPKPILEAMSRMESELCIPLISKDRLIGFCNLGHKTSPRGYSYEDLRLLTNLSQQAAIAFENAILFQEVESRAEALRKSEEKYRLLTEHANDIIFSLDSKGHFVFLNQRVQEVLGFEPDELLERPFVEILAPGSKEKAGAMLEMARSGAPQIYELEMVKKGGTGRVLVEANTVAISDTAGRFMGWQGVARDITDRKLMEEQLLRSEKLRALGEIASGVAHDFNNILAAIVARAGLLMLKAEAQDLRQGLEIIEKAAMDGATAVRRLQGFTRMRADREYSAVDVNQAVRDVLSFTQARWKDEAWLNGITYEIVEALGDVPLVQGDISELREALTNLILNALDAMPQGGRLLLETAFIGGRGDSTGEEQDRWVEVRVTDTGHGMTEEVKRRAFDPFFTTKGVKGTGLGLSIVYGIVQRHQGRILLESEPGKGTTFIIRLRPFSQPGRAQRKEERPMSEPAQALVIDDEESVLEALAEILKNGQHHVTLARTGEEGLKAFKEGHFDIVFTDLGLPDLSGWDVARAIKSIDHRVVVALVTGWGMMVDEGKARENGVDLVIDKPFRIQQILNVVAEAVAGRRENPKGKDPLHEA